MVAAIDQPLRYVVLRHEGVESTHFDLMFETGPGSALATWRSAIWPVDRQTRLTKLPDHRRDYLAYEGPVSGGRGWVRRVAAGAHTVQHPTGTWVIEFLPPDLLPALFMLEITHGEWAAWPGA